MGLFDKNTNYNPNDPNSNRYLPIGGSAPAPTPQYSAGALGLINLSKPLFNTPFVSSSDPLGSAKADAATGTPLNFDVPQGTKPLGGGNTLLAPAEKALSKGGSIPGLIPAPSPAPIQAPANNPVAKPIVNTVPNPSPISTAPATPSGKSFYREGGSLYDSASGAKILNAAELKAGGYNSEVAKPTAIDPGATGSGTGGNNPASDAEIQNILKLAGEAGIALPDAMTMVENYNSLTEADRSKIKDSLGISDVVAAAYNDPSQTTMDYYTKGYNASELPGIKDKVSKLDEVIAQRNKDLATAVEDLQNNPWLSQASRTGRLGILNDKANADIANLTAQRLQLINQYDKGVTALESDVTRYKDQLESDRTINANKLNYLLNEAEKQYATASSAKKTANLKYLPSYLNAAADKATATNAYAMEKARLENLKLSQETGQANDVSNPNGSYTNIAIGIVGGYDISSYATDPTHEQKVQSLLSNMGQFKSVSDIDSYIKNRYPDSPVTGQMIANAAGKYGVSWEMMTAMMEQDSSLGTKGLGAKNNNPGNIGQFDSLGTNGVKGYKTMQEGVDAVASWLSRHKSSTNTAVSATDDPFAAFKSILTPNGATEFSKLNATDQGNVALLINGDALSSDIAKGMGGAKYAQTLLAAATRVDPTYSENVNKQRYSYKAQFNNPNGKEQLQINSINTALGHLAEFNSDAQKLGNNILLPYNKLVNYLKKNTGDPAVANLNTVVTALSGELASVYKGGGAPTDQETEQWRNTILSSFSQSQTSGVAGTAANLISSKLKALNSSYKNVMGAYPENSIIDQNALAQLKEAGVDTSAIEQTLALQANYIKGQVYSFGDGSQHTYLGNNQFSD